MSRSVSRYVLLSIALHCVLFAALLLIRPRPSVGTATSVINVRLVRLDKGPDSDVSGDSDAAEPAEAAQEARDATQTEPAPVDPAATPTPSVAQSPPAAPPAPSAAPTPRSSAPPPAAEEALEEAVVTRRKLPLPPAPSAAIVANTAPVVSLGHTEPQAEPAPERRSISPKQQRMLSREVEELAARFDGAEGSRSTVAWKHKGQEYTASFTPLAAGDSMGIDQAVVTVTTHVDGQELSTEMHMSRLAFSSFAQFVDRWDPDVQIHDDEIDGRFHSNSDIYIGDSFGIRPTFRGRVTTSRGINTPDSRWHIARKDIFLGGLQTHVKPILLPKRFLPFPAEAKIDDDRVQRVAEDSSIRFYPDGTFAWRALTSTAREQRRALSSKPFYLVAADDTELHVSGVVNGKVLVYSPEKIVIDHDLIYASDPETNADSDDYLGLVSDKNVEVAEPQTTGPGDLAVQAAIYARRRFVIERYSSARSGTLSVYGSVSAGSVSATEPRYGTKLQFDRRFEKLRPPRFPMTGRYEITGWDGKWLSDQRAAASP